MFFSPKIGMRFIYSLPVFILFASIAGLYYCYLYGFLLVLPVESVIASAIIFHTLLVLLIWSYIMSLMTDPGTPPKEFQSSQEDLPQENLNTEDVKTAKITQCKVCNTIRPPRTHHCQHCDRCVLRRDHHCPWVANCVGFYNHRFFIQFLSYTTLTSTVLTFSCLSTMEINGWGYNIQSLVGFIVGLLIVLGLGGFTIFHYYLLCINSTSTEFKPGYHFNVFNTTSCKSNCSQVLGKNIIGYILPIRTSFGVDPVSYPVRIRNNLGEILNYKNKIPI